MRASELRVRTTGVSWREVNGDVIALDLESSSYFSTNRSGSLMWKALVDGTTRERMIELLQSEYGLAHEAASNDVEAFVVLLREHKLLDAPG